MDILAEKSLEKFLNEEVLKRALGMTAINVGEQIKNITPEFRKEPAEIPWKVIAGMRNIIVYKYQFALYVAVLM